MLKKIIKKIIRLVLSPFIFLDYLKFKSADKKSRFKISAWDLYPKIRDKTIKTGFDRHYVYHTSWAARKVREISPTKHIDISSSLYFCGIVSAYVETEFYDYRPADLFLPNLKSLEGNLLGLPFESGSVESISCMHTVEHIGLGRYGDTIDPDADIRAIEELKRVTKSGGNLIFVVPIGKTAKIEYNAHRIYAYNQVMNYFDGFDLREFSLIPEDSNNGGIIIGASVSDIKDEKYACGCFWFIKK